MRPPIWLRLLAVALAVSAMITSTGPGQTGNGSSVSHGSSLVSPPLVLIDPFITSQAQVAEIEHSASVVCLLRVDIWEPNRPDAHRLKVALRLGDDGTLTLDHGPLDHAPLDLSRPDQVLPVFDDRLALCRAKGLTAVMFGLSQPPTDTAKGQVRYAQRSALLTALSELARQHGLRVVASAPPGSALRCGLGGEPLDPFGAGAGIGGTKTTSGS